MVQFKMDENLDIDFWKVGGCTMHDSNDMIWCEITRM